MSDGKAGSAHLLSYMAASYKPILGPVFGSSQGFLLKVDEGDRLQFGDLWIVPWCQHQVLGALLLARPFSLPHLWMRHLWNNNGFLL